MGILKEFSLQPFVHLGWKCSRFLLESLQLLSIFVSGSFGWPEDITNTFIQLNVLRIDLTDDAYIAMFIIICTIICAYFILSVLFILIGCDWCDCECDEMSDVIWFFIGDAILFGILFIPVCSNILEMLHCVQSENNGNKYVLFKNQSLDCDSPEHVFYAIWSVITILILIIGCILRGLSHDLELHNVNYPSRFRVDIHYLEMKYVLFRLLGIICGLLLFELNRIMSAILVFIVFGFVLFYTIYWIPYVLMKYNLIRCTMDAFNFWTSFASMINAIDNRNSMSGFILWCIFPVFLIVCIVLCFIRLKYRPLTKQDLRIAADNDNILMAVDIENPYLLDTMLNHDIYQLLHLNTDQCISIQPYSIQKLIDALETRKQTETIEDCSNNKKSNEKIVYYDWKCIFAVYQPNFNPKETQRDKKQKKTKKKKEQPKETSDDDDDGDNDDDSQQILLSSNQMEKLCFIISHCPGLIVLRLNKWNLNKERLYDIITCICQHEHNHLQIIDLGNNQIDLNDATMILDTIYTAQTKIQQEEKVHEPDSLGGAVGNLSNLKKINLQANYINIAEWSEQLIENHPLGSLLVI